MTFKNHCFAGEWTFGDPFQDSGVVAEYVGGRLGAVSMDPAEKEIDREREIGSKRESKRESANEVVTAARAENLSFRRSAPQPTHGLGERSHSLPWQ